ncbi:hypothetical protein ABZ436_13075 [Micromonospora matsumotoense]|uniref:hypothetical protein n=1 Tax=Micromonospora matsumotoense TaxID=121616 RepID=UPI0033FA7E15
MSLATGGGTISGGGEVCLAERTEFPGNRDLTLRNFTLVNNRIVENPCADKPDHQQHHPDQLDDQPLLTRPTRDHAAPPPGGGAAAPPPGRACQPVSVRCRRGVGRPAHAARHDS